MRRPILFNLLLLALVSSACDEATDDAMLDTTPAEMGVVIRNTASEPLFIQGRAAIFTLTAPSGEVLVLDTQCACEVCGTQDTCDVFAPEGRAAELPAGAELAVRYDLQRWSEVPFEPEACPEITVLDTCGVPSALAPGVYTITVSWDDQAAVEAQGLAPDGGQRFGLATWENPQLGEVTLSQESSASVTLEPGVRNEVTVEIGR